MANGITTTNGLVAVSVGATLIDLQASKPGQVSGSAAAKMYGGIGLTTNYSGASDATRFGSRSTVVNADNTYGLIFQIDAANRNLNLNVLFIQSVSGSPLLTTGITVASMNHLKAIVGGGSVSLGAFTFLAGVPYFVATSYSTTNFNTVLLRLDTGQIFTQTGTGTFTSPGSADGTYDVGNAPSFGAGQLLGGVSAAMFSPILHSLTDLLLWAQDPWAFWYPRTLDLSAMLSVAAAAVNFAPQAFFETVKLKRPTEFSQGPFAGLSPPLSGAFATSPFFDQVKLKQPIINTPDIVPPFPPPKLAGERWFDPVKLKPPIIDNPPVLLQATAATANIVEQTFFEPVRLLKRPSEFAQGSFAGTSPSGTFATSAFFDQVKLKQPIIDKPTDLPPLIAIVNFSASNWFDVLKPLKPPEGFGQLYPQQYWTPQSYDKWFDQIKLLKIPERMQEAFGVTFPPPILETGAFFDIVKVKQPAPGFDFLQATAQPATIQNALTDWFATVKLKQPIIDQPLVVYFPAQVIPPPSTDVFVVMFFANVGKLMGH